MSGINIPIKLSDCPEEVTADGVKIYGEVSLENQMAVLSHYLHGCYELDDESKREIFLSIRDFLDRKEFKQDKERKKSNKLSAWLDGCECCDDEKISMVTEEAMQYGFFDDFFKVPFPGPKTYLHTFIDLFAGIGGIRLPFSELGYKCVFSSEWDAPAQKTYFANFGEMPFGDITKIKAEKIPKHDLLLAGFPCQAFSIMGKGLGFEDTRGTMFFEIERILNYYQSNLNKLLAA